jgi:nucleoside-diphosphate-sugar epimerase
VNESHPVKPQTARSQRRADAEEQLRGWARRNQVKAVILRVPGIYAEDRLPLNRLRDGIPCIIDSEDSYTNHIHADDLARVVAAALRHGAASRVFHASDDSQMKAGAYLDVVADAFGLPRVPRISRTEARRVLPESLLSFMNESRRLDNRRMKSELKVKLRHPAVAGWIAALRRPSE